MTDAGQIPESVIQDVLGATPPPPDPFQIELRGYEVARLTGGRWVPVSTWRPNNQSLNEALNAAKWLNERHPREAYTVRPVVSMLPPQATPAKDELHLTADELYEDAGDEPKETL